MEFLERADLSVAAGINGDSRGKPGARQVTVLSASAWLEACNLVNTDQPWLARRANVLVDGLDLRLSEGGLLFLGDDIQLLITGELEPCARMDDASPGLKLALADDWRGGVTCRVQRGGTLIVGAGARLQSPA